MSIHAEILKIKLKKIEMKILLKLQINKMLIV